MIKKIMIEQKDKEKMNMWETDRIKIVHKKLNELDEDEEIYVIGFDIANKYSKDQSVMIQFRVVDDRYIYEGIEII